MAKLPMNREDLLKRWSAGERFQFYFFYGYKPPESGVDRSCFSQWFLRPFSIDSVEYPTAEHWMMAEKARLFEDDEMLAEILACETPREAKALGRKVQNFDNEIWGQHKFAIVVRGNLAKFSQHEDFKQFLLGTIVGAPRELDPGSDSFEGDSTKSGLAGYDRETQSNSSLVKERLAMYRAKMKNSESDSSDDSTALSDVILVEAAGRDTIWGIGLGARNPKAQDPHTWRGLNLLGFALNEVREQLAGVE